MAQRLSAARRLSTAARWPVGVALTSWRYMWRTTPMRRVEEPAAWEENEPPALPQEVSLSEVQRPGHGVGPMFHRLYRIRIGDACVEPVDLMARVSGDPDAVAPTEFASFQKVSGHEGSMRTGDEYVVRMPGPWDGPVRVVEVTPYSFRLATLEGHLEAGQIVFAATASDGLVEFTIESWAQSADRFCDLLYDRLRMAKEIQLHMWTSFLERVVELSVGRREGLLEIHTRRVDEVPDGA
jgi:hypothetical protein